MGGQADGMAVRLQRILQKGSEKGEADIEIVQRVFRAEIRPEEVGKRVTGVRLLLMQRQIGEQQAGFAAAKVFDTAAVRKQDAYAAHQFYCKRTPDVSQPPISLQSQGSSLTRKRFGAS